MYEDSTCVGFLTIAPVTPGHTLVVPKNEVDKWTDLPAEEFADLNIAAQRIGNAIVHGFASERAGYLIAGFEVAHTHIHVFPANDMSGFDLSVTNPHPTEASQDAAQSAIISALTELGNGQYVPTRN